ncbi:MAG: signal peptidase II [Pseudomonadales bacterium]
MKLHLNYLLSLVIVVFDQTLKYYMAALLPLCRPGHCETIELLPFFKLIVAHNTGAAFSFLATAGGWQRWFLVAVSCGVSGVIIVWLHRLGQEQRLLAASLTLILGGAIGNLIDRLLQGYVVDFILLHYGSFHFPAFNIADTAITLGAALYILDMLLSRKDAA